MMSEFTLLAVLLSLAAGLFVCLPLFSGRISVGADHNKANVAAYQARLRELQADLKRGDYAEQEYQRLLVEAQRRLLEESGGAVGQQDRSSFRWPALLLALLIPLASIGIYQQLGAEKDWQLARIINQVQQQAQAGEDNQAAMRHLVAQLREQLASDESNKDYWMMLGRTEMELAEYDAAAQSFTRLAQLLPNDDEVLALSAQALYLAAGGELNEEVKAVADQALAINPYQPTVLGLLGVHYYRLGEWQQALEYWQQLLQTMDLQTEAGRMIAGAVSQLRQKLSLPPAAEVEPASLTLKVALSAELAVEPEWSVFVYARALQGPKMPLAVARLTVADLPAEVTLNDTMAMAPSLKLSGFDQVELIARVSPAGVVTPAAGDLQGLLGPVDVADPAVGLQLLIDQVLP